MNKKGNQRYQETCQRIEGATMRLLENKEVEQITVSEICREANVHRTTFYGHYKDIPNLMNHVAARTYKDIMEGFESADNETPGEGFVRLFYYIKENQQTFRSLMDYYSPRRFHMDLFPPNTENFMKKIVERSEHDDKETIFYHYTFFSEGMNAVIYRWLERKCEESPEEMWEIIAKEYNQWTR